jgi:hypothetical protein
MQPGSYFRELRNNFLGIKILQFFDADPGFGMEKFGSRICDKHPGSATLDVAIIKIQTGFAVKCLARKMIE